MIVYTRSLEGVTPEKLDGFFDGWANAPVAGSAARDPQEQLPRFRRHRRPFGHGNRVHYRHFGPRRHGPHSVCRGATSPPAGKASAAN